VFFTFVALFLLLIRGKLEFHRKYLYFFLFLALISILQGLKYSYFPISTKFGTMIRFFVPYLLLLFVGEEFPKYFVRVLYLLTIIGFFFYFSSLLIPGFFEMISTFPSLLGLEEYGQGHNFLIYTADPGRRLGLLRFSGMFNEPGKHASFLTLGIMLNILMNDKMFTKKNLVFIVALVFTFSNAGYLIFLFIMTFYFWINLQEKKRYISLFLLIIIVPLALNVYTGSNFFAAQLRGQTRALVRQYGDYGSGSYRTVTTYNDFLASLTAPLIGRGRDKKTRYTSEMLRTPDFITYDTTFDIAAQWGYPFFILYFTLIYFTFKKMSCYYNASNKYAILFTFLIGLSFASQNLFLTNSFLTLLYLGFFLPNRTDPNL